MMTALEMFDLAKDAEFWFYLQKEEKLLQPGSQPAAIFFPASHYEDDGEIEISIDSQERRQLIDREQIDCLLASSEPVPEMQQFTRDNAETWEQYCNFRLYRITQTTCYFCIFILTEGDKSDWTISDEVEESEELNPSFTVRRVKLDPDKIIIHPPQTEGE